MDLEITPGQMIPQYENKYFTQFYSSPELFIEDYKTCGLPVILKDDSLTTLFYLLYSRYGNSPIANSDENQFKYKMFSIIFQYGPTWEKRLEIQTELRGLTISQAAEGARSIYNHAYNPGTSPSTQDTEELNYVNDQNVSKYTKSPTQAAMDLWDILRVDVSEAFLKQFQKLFLRVVRPQHTYIYTTEYTTEGGGN